MKKNKKFTPAQVDRFLGLPKGAFNHIPGYAQSGALAAIANVRELEEKNIFRPGLYYIVLADLTASTRASKSLGIDLNKRRVETFVTACVEALGLIKLNSYAQFLKEIGDATLFIFSSFDDLMSWWECAENQFWSYNEEWRDEIGDSERFQDFIIKAKTVVHLGEVSYGEGSNPISHAVNQVFKIEKLFNPYELGCTEQVRLAASPLFQKYKIEPRLGHKVILPGENTKTSTWTLRTSDFIKSVY